MTTRWRKANRRQRAQAITRRSSLYEWAVVPADSSDDWKRALLGVSRRLIVTGEMRAQLVTGEIGRLEGQIRFVEAPVLRDGETFTFTGTVIEDQP